MAYSKEFLRGLYRQMQLIRQSDEALVVPITDGEVRCPCHLSCGQEAVAVGVCAALKAGDVLFGGHRSHGHYLAKGGRLSSMMAEIYGREDGCARGRGGSMHLIEPEAGMLGAAPIVGGTISLALGAALAASIREDGGVAAAFFGDGAVGEGVLYEAMNFAALRRLPLILVCENNFYSTHLSISECRVQRDIFRISEPFGIPGRQIDGNDVLEVFEAAREAISRARRGRGPSLLECRTYRLRGHVGPDDNIQGTHTDIRPKSEIARWRKRDPILRFAAWMTKNGFATKPELRVLDAAVESEVREAVDHARRSPSPNPEDVTRHVFR